MGESLKIGVLAPPWNAVPPTDYGGTELIVDILCRGYRAAGHRPVLFASGDSTCPVEREHVLETARMPPDKYQEHLHIAHFLRRARELNFDIVHSHLEAIHPYADTLSRPVVCTLHVEMTPERERFLRHNRSVRFIGVSANHAASFPMEVSYIHHGLEMERFPCCENPDHYLLFIGEISERKGADIAARTAKELGIPLKLAGPRPSDHELWFEREVIGLGSGIEIEYLGPVGFAEKVELYKRAKAVLCPVRWEEPFGLVAIEAMACGTPVAAIAHGAFPEVIENGLTGYLSEDEEGFQRAVIESIRLDRRACRERVVRRFNHERMVAAYLALFESLV